MSLQIECLAPLIPQNGNAASSSTASLSSLPSATPVSSPSGWTPPSSTLFPVHEGEVLHRRDAKVKSPLLSVSVELLPELLFIHMLGVFPDFYQRSSVTCGRRGRRSRCILFIILLN